MKYAKLIFRLLLGMFMTYAGFSHLTFNRQEFVAQVPTWLQFSPEFTDFVVLASGVVEIAFGLGIIFLAGKWRAIAGSAAGRQYPDLSEWCHLHALERNGNHHQRLLVIDPVLQRYPVYRRHADHEWLHHHQDGRRQRRRQLQFLRQQLEHLCRCCQFDELSEHDSGKRCEDSHQERHRERQRTGCQCSDCHQRRDSRD